MSRHRSGEGYQNISTALKVLNKFGTIKTLPRAEQSEEKALGQGGDQELDGHSYRASEFLCGDERNVQKDNHLCSTPPIRPLWWSGQTEATPQLKAHDKRFG